MMGPKQLRAARRLMFNRCRAMGMDADAAVSAALESSAWYRHRARLGQPAREFFTLRRAEYCWRRWVAKRRFKGRVATAYSLRVGV